MVVSLNTLKVNLAKLRKERNDLDVKVKSSKFKEISKNIIDITNQIKIFDEKTMTFKRKLW